MQDQFHISRILWIVSLAFSTSTVWTGNVLAKERADKTERREKSSEKRKKEELREEAREETREERTRRSEHDGVRVVVVSPANRYTGRTKDLSVWCNDILAELKLSAEIASRKRDRGDNCGAVEELRTGLNRVSENIPFHGRSLFTAHAVERGKALSDAIAESVGTEPGSLAIQRHFLFDYYAFIENVYDQLDRNYYLPYIDCKRCNERDPYGDREFERRFISLGKEGLTMVLKTLALKTSSFDDREERHEERNERRWRSELPPIVSVGPSGAFLSALATQALFTEQDLRDSTYANRYACVIKELDELSRNLESGRYDGEVESVNIGYDEAERLANEIQSPTRACDGYVARFERGYDRDDSFRDPIRIFGELNLQDTNSGEFVRVPGGPRDIARITMNVEAVRYEAKLLVEINGRQFEMPVPARDPVVKLDINENDVRTIEFRNLAGGLIKIRNIVLQPKGR